MDPTVAKGAAKRRSATQAIMYPPEAATLSMHTVSRTRAARSRSSWFVGGFGGVGGEDV